MATTYDAQIYIYESEYIAILSAAKEFLQTETGGDLYGSFSHGGMPVIWLASRAGPKAKGEEAHFQQDAAFTTAWQQHLHEHFGLQHIGSWHSHHQLSLKEPSSGDVRAAQAYAQRHERDKVLEIIVNHEERETIARPYFYPNAQYQSWVSSGFVRLPGESPVRMCLGEKWDQMRYPTAIPTIETRDSREKERGKKPVSSATNTTTVLPEVLREEIQNVAESVESIEAKLREDVCILVIRKRDDQVVAIAIHLQQLIVLQVNLVSQNNTDISKLLREQKIPFDFKQRIPVLASILHELPYIQQRLQALQHKQEAQQRQGTTTQTQQRELEEQQQPALPQLATQEKQIPAKMSSASVRNILLQKLESANVETWHITEKDQHIIAKLDIDKDHDFVLSTQNLSTNLVTRIVFRDKQQKSQIDISDILQQYTITLPYQSKKPSFIEGILSWFMHLLRW